MKTVAISSGVKVFLMLMMVCLLAPPAGSAVLPASAGRQYPTSHEGCWETYYTSMVNNCGGGTTDIEKWLVPINILAFGTYNVRVKVYGQAFTSGPWASCVAVSADGGFYAVSARDNTSTGLASVQEINLGTIFTGFFNGGISYTSTYFDCDVTNGGRVVSVNYWQ